MKPLTRHRSGEPLHIDSHTLFADVHVATDVGRLRDHNEDASLVAWLAEPAGQPESSSRPAHGLILLVADGMGGAAAGEVASSMATSAVVQQLRREWENGRPADVESFAESLCSALVAANEKIHQASQAADGPRGMGTTSTLVGIFGNQLCTAQVGDSRAYLLRNGSLVQLTRDQTLVQRLVDAGQLTEEEADASERKNVLLQALGPEATVQPDVAIHDIRPRDLVLVCSDGLAGPIGRSRLAEVVRVEASLPERARYLIDAANGAGGPDNITVVLARFS